jgi:hypothetical protein
MTRDSLNFTQGVTFGAFEQEKPRALIEWFDSWFDVRLEHDRCLKLLREAGAFSLSDSDAYHALSIHLGATWCEMIKWDVRYDLRRGGLVRDRSRIAADLLAKWTAEQIRTGQELVLHSSRFATNMLARWFDGAGKLYFRNREYTDARKMFEQALSWAKEGEHWFLVPDLRSNHVRADFEEQRTAGKMPDLVAEYTRLHKETVAQARGRNISIPFQSDSAEYDQSMLRDEPGRGAPREEREFLRGLCSILHNMSLAEEPPENSESFLEQWNGSLTHSEESAAIAEAMRDEYRLAQAINHQAKLMAKRAKHCSCADDRQECLDRAKAFFARVRDQLRWQRGRLIAWQQSAVLATQASNSLTEIMRGIDELKRLLGVIKSHSAFATGEQSGDLEIYDYTVRALREVATRLEGWNETTEHNAVQAYDQLLKLVEDEELTVARAVRRVVKVTVYKQHFNRQRVLVYEREVAKHIGKREFQRALALLEEATGRELLDILALDANAGAEGELASFDWIPPSVQSVYPVPISATTFTEPSAQRRHGLRRSSEAVSALRQAYLTNAMQEFDYEAREHPISVTPHDPEICEKIVDLSRREPGLAVVRHVSLPRRNGVGRSLAAFVVRNGELTLHDLDWSAAEVAFREMVQCDPSSGATVIVPHKEQARILWDTLMAPLWRTIVPSPDDLPEHLVFVPHLDTFQVPLHLALEHDEALPLAARVPLAFSVSGTMHFATLRYRKRWLNPRADDDLCAIIGPDVSGNEICKTGWDAKRLHVFGNDDGEMSGYEYYGEAEWECLEKTLSEITPEFLVVGCHGSYDADDQGQLGPTLNFGQGIPYASQYDIARRLHLPGNLFTALAACVSGQGAALEGGDVAGFVRSFIAAGAGALGVTLFSVLDEEIVRTVQHLLSATRWAPGSASVDLVATLQRYYASRCSGLDDADKRIDACPLVIYL